MELQTPLLDDAPNPLPDPRPSSPTPSLLTPPSSSAQPSSRPSSRPSSPPPSTPNNKSPRGMSTKRTFPNSSSFAQPSLFDKNQASLNLSLNNTDENYAPVISSSQSTSQLSELDTSTPNIQLVQEEELKEVINGQFVPEGQPDEILKSFPRTAWKLWLKESGLAADGRGSRAMAWLQSVIAGWLSAVGYIVLYSLYIGPMSGNTITLAASITHKQAPIALSRLATLGVYCIGTAMGTFCRELCNLYKYKRVSALLFTLELLCVLTFFILGQFYIPDNERHHEHWGFYILMVPAVLSLSFQIVALQRVGTMPMSSTVITTTLARASGELVSYGFLRQKYLSLKIKITKQLLDLENLTKNFEAIKIPSPTTTHISTPISTPATHDPRIALKKQIKQDQKSLKEMNSKLKEHLAASFFYWMMWFCYFLGAMFGALFYIELELELWSTLPVMAILFILVVADITADF